MQEKPIKVYAPSKSGSMFIFELMKNIEKHSRWGYNKNPKIIGPIRNHNLEGCDFKYVVHLRNPLDLLISSYWADGWYHPYLGPPEKKARWDENRAEIQKTSLDEFCLHRMKSNAKRLERLIRSALSYNASFVTYEDMVLDYDRWARTFIVPFNIGIQNIQKIVDAQRAFVTNPVKRRLKNGIIIEHVRNGRPGEFVEALKEPTIAALRDNFTDILGFMQSINLGTYNYFTGEHQS